MNHIDRPIHKIYTLYHPNYCEQHSGPVEIVRQLCVSFECGAAGGSQHIEVNGKSWSMFRSRRKFDLRL